MRRALRRAVAGDVQVTVTGMGQAAARTAASEWLPRAAGVVVCGTAGGTGGLARAGDVVVASGLHGAAAPVRALELPGALLGVVASLEAPLDSLSERARLLAAGVMAVETEAAAWATACAAAGVPLVVVRAVLDTPEEPLGPALGMVRLGARGPSPGAVAGILLRPREWGALRRLGAAAAAAEKRAADVAVRAATQLAIET